MKINYKTPPLNNGGGAVSGCGTIHKSEIAPTLDQLTADWTGMSPVNFNECLVGSTGKREYSGDIDLVLDTKWCKLSSGAIADFLREMTGAANVARHGEMVHLKYPIKNFDASQNEIGPRTGFVQIDFNIGDAAWEKVYHFSPGDKSAYKGAHRNLGIAAITTVVDVTRDDEVDTFNRPIVSKRWKWSPHGFVRVIRQSQRDKNTNVWMKKQLDTVIDGPYFDADRIASILFEDGTAADIESLETLMVAVKRNFGMVDQERIWKRMAENFSDWSQGKDFWYPPEIDKYIR